MPLVTAARTGEEAVADGEEQVVMPSLVGQRGCAGCRCRTGALALPRLTGIPHSQFSRRLKQRLQTCRLDIRLFSISNQRFGGPLQWSESLGKVGPKGIKDEIICSL